MSEDVKVVVVLAISVDVVAKLSVDFCHFITVPTFPDKVISDAELPVHTV
jgi:hypothetical protein